MQQEGYFAIRDINGYTWSYSPDKEELHIDPIYPADLPVLCESQVTLEEAIQYVDDSTGGEPHVRFIPARSSA